jgi:hypothetical protein
MEMTVNKLLALFGFLGFLVFLSKDDDEDETWNESLIGFEIPDQDPDRPDVIPPHDDD